MPNYAFTTGKQLPQANNGDTFEMCNFMQMNPHTPIFVGITGLTFRKCNLTNCDVPPDSILDDSPVVHFSLCSNLHSKLIDKGLPVESENCPHVIDIDTVTIDGIVVDTIYHYKDTRVI